jgi:hypothetical protein
MLRRQGICFLFFQNSSRTPNNFYVPYSSFNRLLPQLFISLKIMEMKRLLSTSHYSIGKYHEIINSTDLE